MEQVQAARQELQGENEALDQLAEERTHAIQLLQQDKRRLSLALRNVRRCRVSGPRLTRHQRQLLNSVMRHRVSPEVLQRCAEGGYGIPSGIAAQQPCPAPDPPAFTPNFIPTQVGRCGKPAARTAAYLAQHYLSTARLVLQTQVSRRKLAMCRELFVNEQCLVPNPHRPGQSTTVGRQLRVVAKYLKSKTLEAYGDDTEKTRTLNPSVTNLPIIMLWTHSFVASQLHVLWGGLLLIRLFSPRGVSGVSLVTQELLLIVYVSRYLELLALYRGLADTLAKILKIGLALAVVVLMRYSGAAASYAESAQYDSVPRLALLLPTFGLAVVFNKFAAIVEIMHQFSWYLEALVLLPQFVLLWRKAKYDGWLPVLLALMGADCVVDSLPLLLDWRQALASDPYRESKAESRQAGRQAGLYAMLVMVAVLGLGFLLLLFQRLTSRAPSSHLLNESTNKPGFNDVWDANKFAFAEAGTASASSQSLNLGAGPPGGSSRGPAAAAAL
ncbi:hypothetical protein QJQ45_029805 [Haematococcus lacustris]|nr:hypothetical protein QJQ45_029805 [Haematococcus lacustris]